MTRERLDLEKIRKMAREFCISMSKQRIEELYGVTDGKAVGTYIEHGFRDFLAERYDFEYGSSAVGIDLPSVDLNTDVKVTSIKQPQSSCPFRDARQKIYGLGYNLLLFVYEKSDNVDGQGKYSILKFVSCAFISKERTGDYQLTKQILQILDNDGNADDLFALFEDKNLPGDEITYNQIAEEVLKNPPTQGYLTISNALQWRLQYRRIVNMSSISGIVKIV